MMQFMASTFDNRGHSAHITNLNGGSTFDIVRSWAVAYGTAYAGQYIAGSGWNPYAQVAAGVAVGTAAGVASGGDFRTSFYASAFTAAASAGTASLTQNQIAGTIISATIGGTASEISGGKFANGAITGAFAYALAAAITSSEEALTTNESGVPLPDSVKEALGPYFEGFDLDVIRTHEGIAAYVIGDPRAYTSGNNIYFEPGAYQPNTAAGIALIGHEVLHSRQYAELGAFGFRFRYGAEYFSARLSGLNHYNAYRNISFERSAFALERQINIDLLRAGYR